MRLITRYIIVFVTIAALLTGCTVFNGVRNGSFSSSAREMKGSFTRLSGTTKKTVKFKQGDIVAVNYNIELDKGSLSIKITDSQGNELFVAEGEGNGRKELNRSSDGNYTVIITGSDAGGSYNINWDVKK